jgi:nucleoside-diphosphate-sugar epimerase
VIGAQGLEGKRMKHVLVTGAVGQIGSELIPALRQRLGGDRVVAAGHRKKPDREFLEAGPFHYIDCARIESIAELVKRYRIDTIFHLAAILSARAEKNPSLAWSTNVDGLRNVLEVAREYRCAVFSPSSIATFGPTTPATQTPQDTLQRPTTLYGISKVAGELLGDYYFNKYGVDTRGLRYPGLISHTTLPGGGTTDYAVEIYLAAVRNRTYTCYLKADTFLDMMYMPDALRAAIELMEADPGKLRHRNAFNLSAMTLAPETVAAEIKTHLPDFTIRYEVDPLRQAIAETWPNSMDDRAAREEWGWQPRYDLETMTRDMLENLSKRHST